MKTINSEVTQISFKVVVSLPQNDGKAIFPTDNSIESLRERLINGEVKDVTFVDLGYSWSTFGVEVEVDSPELIKHKSKEIHILINRILRAEKPLPPVPPIKKDIDETVFSMGEKNGHGLESVVLNRKIYGYDGRQFDTIRIRGKCIDEIVENLQYEKHSLLAELKNSPFSYGILQHSLSVTFLEGTKVDFDKFKATLKILMEHT